MGEDNTLVDTDGCLKGGSISVSYNLDIYKIACYNFTLI